MHQQELLPPERYEARTRAKAIYTTLEGDLEARCKGQIVAIEVESGDHFLGATVRDAASKARIKHPNKVLHFFRIGFPTVYVWR